MMALSHIIPKPAASLNYPMILLIFVTSNIHTQTNISLEAEAATLSGTANVVNCTSASGGQMVRDIGNQVANAILFENINLEQAGSYFITISYFSVSERSISYQLNDATAKTNEIPASGLWCYQGGSPADYVLEEDFVAGNNSLRFYNAPLIDKVIISSDTSAREGAVFYVSAVNGNDSNNGLSLTSAWQSLAKVNALNLVPGDSLLFATGETYTGKLTLINESGTATNPIVVSSYGSGAKPIIDGDGYLSCIHLLNSEYIQLSGLEITNNGGAPRAGDPTNLRYGLYLQNTYTDGTVLEHYQLRDLTFQNIYPTDQITDDDQTNIHAYALNTSGSFGDAAYPTRFNDMLIEDCFFTRTGRHALRVLATNKLRIKNNLFEQVGGAGMVLGANCSNILVEGNTTNYTGSNIDSRMAARGSGIWAFKTKNLTVQHNKFLYARGIKDSFGMHIDIGNRNVVYQYNYSEDNEGGFVEILGDNVNVGYRYNLSVGDGWRSRGSQLGRIFWVGGWSGNPANPIGSDSVFIYNNSIFVPDNIAPRIWIEAVTKNTRIYNNIVYTSNNFSDVFIKNEASLNDFDHNVWYGNIPTTDTDGQSYRGPNALTTDPLFSDQVVMDAAGFVLQGNSPALANGKLISNPNSTGPYNYFDNNGGLDYFGNAVSANDPPNIGAANGDVINSNRETFSTTFALFPNPVKSGRSIQIEIPEELSGQSLSIQLMDATGRVLLDKVYQQQDIRLETRGLVSGTYLVKIWTGTYRLSRWVVVF